MPNEITIRIICFITIFALVAVWELVTPRRALTTSKKKRWFSNLSFIIGNPILLRLVMPILAVDATLIAQGRGWGLLNNITCHIGLNSLPELSSSIWSFTSSI